MEEPLNEGNEYAEDEYQEEEAFEAPDAEAAEGVEELTEAQRNEAADLAKLLKQHPEIWIPYEEQVQEKLNTHAPGAAEETSSVHVNLRDLASLDKHHVTYPFLTNYERTKCISFRASQISNGAKPYILVPEGVTDAYMIAKMELEAKRLPFILRRPLPDGNFEVWRLSDLVLL